MSDTLGFAIVLALIFTPGINLLVATIGGKPIMGFCGAVGWFAFVASLFIVPWL